MPDEIFTRFKKGTFDVKLVKKVKFNNFMRQLVTYNIFNLCKFL